MRVLIDIGGRLSQSPQHTVVFRLLVDVLTSTYYYKKLLDSKTRIPYLLAEYNEGY